MSQLFKPGDRVMRREGGPVMEVIRYVQHEGAHGAPDSFKVECAWYDSRKGKMTDVCNEVSLMHATSLSGCTFASNANSSTMYGVFRNVLRNLTQREAMETFDQLSAAISFLNNYDYIDEFSVAPGYLISLRDGKKFIPEEITLVKTFHLEGFSNMDDMSVLYAMKTDDGTKGWIANARGKYANADLDSLLLRIKENPKPDNHVPFIPVPGTEQSRDGHA